MYLNLNGKQWDCLIILKFPQVFISAKVPGGKLLGY